MYATSVTQSVEDANAGAALTTALAALGVTATTLTPAQRAELDTQGFTVFPNVIDATWLTALRDAFEQITVVEGENAGKEVNQVAGVRRLADLVNKGEVFDLIYTHPLVLAAAQYVIGRPFKLHSINGHDPLPGQGQQALHPDWGNPRPDPTVFSVMNSLWILDDFSAENGATRLVPGSQRWPGHPRDQMSDLLAPHPQEIYVSAQPALCSFLTATPGMAARRTAVNGCAASIIVPLLPVSIRNKPTNGAFCDRKPRRGFPRRPGTS